MICEFKAASILRPIQGLTTNPAHDTLLGMKKKPLRILFASRDKFPPFRVDVAVLFGKEMAGRGHRIDWVLQSQDDCRVTRMVPWAGGTAWVGPTNNGRKFIHRAHKHLRRFIHMTRGSSMIRNNLYDIVQVKDSFFSAFIYLYLARLRKIKYVYWLSYPVAEALLYAVREGTARYPWAYFIRGHLYRILLYKLLLKYADHIFVQSEQMKRDIRAQGVSGAEMTAVAMGVDPMLLTNDEDDAGEAETAGPPRLVYLGTLIRVRRIDFLIRVLAQVLDAVPDARLYLVGKGEAKEDIEVLQKEADKFGILNAVVFTGFLERRKALQIVRSADVCMSPFYPTPILNSTSPTKLIEYMALGKAVVANDHPEQKSILQSSGGGICVPYREAEFAAAVISLLKDPDRREKMGKRAKSWVLAHRSYPKIADTVETAYYKCLEACRQ